MIYCLINENRKICRISPVFRWRCCPPPIQKLENISRLLNTNKVRKLEFLLADAKRKGAEVVFTTGGAQSNHAMLTAACAKKLGMEPILILKKRGVTERKGNQLLEYLMDTDVRFMDTDSYDDIYAEMDRVSKASGKKYYKIPCGGSNAGVELVSVLHRGESEASDHA